MKKVAVIGGTGTLGNELVRQLRHKGVTDIRVFSRDECKQQAMARDFPGTDFVIGDIRDLDSVSRAINGVDTVFHVAAMKHIDVVERNPAEGIKTNVNGTLNVIKACLSAGVDRAVFSSTDKAVDAINVYGLTKALGERLWLQANSEGTGRFSCYRWGNVLGSRGSVVHVFANELKRRGVIPITDIHMTRFWIHIEDAVSYMLETVDKAHKHKAMIPPMKAASVVDLAKAVAYVLGVSNPTYEKTGGRGGEKIHESIEAGWTSQSAESFTPRELADMVRRVVA